MTGKTDLRMKMIELGAEEFILDLIKKGKNVKQITNLVNENEEFMRKNIKIYGNNKIDYQSVRKFIAKSKKATQELMKTDKKSAIEYKNMVMDYSSEIKCILKDVKELRDLAKGEKDYASFSALVGRLFQGLELLARISGDIGQPGQVDVNIIYEDISRRMEKQNRDKKGSLFGKGIDIDLYVDKSDAVVSAEIRKNSENKIIDQEEDYIDMTDPNIESDKNA